jgi:hypothetical protein
LHSAAPICTLYQSWPLDMMPLYKRCAYRAVLRRSAVIVVYDALSEHYIRARFPDKEVVRLGLFTDTEYFAPTGTRIAGEPFIFCPGNHRRHEDVLVGIAQRTGMPVVRTSVDRQVARFYEGRMGCGVRFEFQAGFGRVRDLYRNAALVINVVDDRYWPVGVTTFCEALSMDKVVITSAGHSSAGYEFPDGMRPYLTVQNAMDVDEWVCRIQQVLKGEVRFDGPRSPRALAQLLCSEQAAVSTWHRVRELLADRATRNGT